MGIKAMRQQDLACMLGAPNPTSALWPKGGVEVFDLFCGAGGFSQGAVQAGHRVVFACDSDPESIATHERNHPHGCVDRSWKRLAAYVRGDMGWSGSSQPILMFLQDSHALRYTHTHTHTHNINICT